MKDAADAQPGLSLLLNVVGVVWEAVENADTRCWGLLPDKIQVLRIELPAGQHQIGVAPVAQYGAVGAQRRQSVTILDGRNTYLLANFPDARLVGKLSTNQP